MDKGMITIYPCELIKKFGFKFSDRSLKRLLRRVNERLCYIVICFFMQNESQRHNDKGRAKASLEKYVPLTLL